MHAHILACALMHKNNPLKVYQILNPTFLLFGAIFSGYDLFPSPQLDFVPGCFGDLFHPVTEFLIETTKGKRVLF